MIVYHVLGYVLHPSWTYFQLFIMAEILALIYCLIKSENP